MLKYIIFLEQRTEFEWTSQTTVFPTYNLHVSSNWVKPVSHCYAQAQGGVTSFQYPYIWRHLQQLLGVFSPPQNSRKLWELGKLYWLSLGTATHLQLPLNSITSLKWIKDARLEPHFFPLNALVENTPQKLTHVFHLFLLSACCHQLNDSPPYYTVGWTTNDLLLITLRFCKTHYSLQLR